MSPRRASSIDPATTGVAPITAPKPPASFASAWRRARLSVEERKARGRTARTAASRSSHGRWEPSPDRPDPIALIEEQTKGRTSELIPIMYGRMLESPFAFFRGGAAIMAADLAGTPHSGITVQLCGDAHLSNFGVFGTPERRMIFDVNDFDETLPGPWEWDVKRLAASLEVHGRERAFDPADRRAIVVAAAREYRQEMRRISRRRTLDAWYNHLDVDWLLEQALAEVRAERLKRREARAAERLVAKARTRDSVRVFAKRTDRVDGTLRIKAGSLRVVKTRQ